MEPRRARPEPRSPIPVTRYPPWLPPMPPLGQAARPLVNCENPRHSSCRGALMTSPAAHF